MNDDSMTIGKRLEITSEEVQKFMNAKPKVGRTGWLTIREDLSATYRKS